MMRWDGGMGMLSGVFFINPDTLGVVNDGEFGFMMTPSVFMQHAFDVAQPHQGHTWPNPCVGCVIVQGETVVGTGATQVGGRPHAEDVALGQAGDRAQGATVYVTLEPCAHGCVPKLIQARVGHVVAAIEDPDSRTAGQGLEQLRRAGIPVSLGDGGQRAQEVHRGFFSRLQRQRPVVDVKMGVSLDGRVALADGRSQWITGDASRSHVQILRARYDALLTSCKTIVADRARLTCRLQGFQYPQPVRIVVGNTARFTPDMSFFLDLPFFQEEGPLWLITWHPVPPVVQKHVHKILMMTHGESLAEALIALGKEGLTQIMVEAGPALVTSLFQQTLVDRWHLFYAPVMLGGDARPLLGDLWTTDLQRHRLRILERQPMGEDVYIHAETNGHTTIPHTASA